MSKLRTIRRRIINLRRVRALGRWVSAACAALMAILLAALLMAAVDIVFVPNVLARLLIWLLAAVGIGAVAWRICRPLLTFAEDNATVALQVEKRHGLSSDLIAALQFEQPQATAWGSAQLRSAVVDRLADTADGIDVYADFQYRPILKRVVIVQLTLLVVAALAGVFPQHAEVFANRMLLGSAHYPTRTTIVAIGMNDTIVLHVPTDGSRPRPAKAAEGQPLEFAVLCRDELPAGGEIQLLTTAGQRGRKLQLQPLAAAVRRQRLTNALLEIQLAIQSGRQPGDSWVRRVTELGGLDAAVAVPHLQAAGDDPDQLSLAAELLKARRNQLDQSQVYAARLDRLTSGLQYEVRLGDAWTERARVRMMPLPVVEASWTITPPAYAQSGRQPAETTSSLRLAALEGSRLDLVLTSSKPLAGAELTVRTGRDAPVEVFPLEQGQDNRRWRLPGKTALAALTQAIQFEIQVTDLDDLQLPQPLAGVVRLKPDRPPLGAIRVVHRVVLPTARPVVECDLNDDHAVAAAQLIVTLQRARNVPPEDSPGEPDAPSSDVEHHEIELLTESPLRADQLPARRSKPLEFTAWKLNKGDRVSIQMKLTDYRGQRPGQTYLSDPLYLEISDESGVLAAISEADERSEQRLTDIIKQELGIGESP